MDSLPPRVRRSRPILLAMGTFVLGQLWPACGWSDRLLLRNFDVVNTAVKSFDEDGVVLADGKVITWDAIDQGKVDGDRQTAFDKMLKDLGTPLFRIRQRMTVGDYRGLLEHAESVYPRYVQRSSPTAYLVFQSLMWSRIAAGQREMAVEPYFRVLGYLREAKTTVKLPGERRLEFDPKTALTASLQPVWFDNAAAKRALGGVREAAKAMKAPYPEGIFIYYGTLALSAGSQKTGLDMVGNVGGRQRNTAEWKQVALAQHEVLAGKPGAAVARIEGTASSMLAETEAAACYWIGMAKTDGKDRDQRMEGVLYLLRIAALHGKAAPELAAAGLYQAMTTLSDLEDVKGSLAVRRELQVRYGHTLHGAKVRSSPKAPAPTE